MLGGFFGFILVIFFIGVIIINVLAMFRLFETAGEEGWMSIIPILNLAIMLKINNRPMYWVLFILIPVIGSFVAIFIYFEFAKSFNKSGLYCLGVVFLPLIFLPMLAFSDPVYTPIVR